jgi:glycosyltransferase involved in cell wall biosynthesis
MRLLLVGAFPYPHHQGSQVYFQEQAIALRSAGADVSLLTYASDASRGNPSDRNVDVRRAAEHWRALDGFEHRTPPKWTSPTTLRSGPNWAKPLGDLGLAMTLRDALASNRRRTDYDAILTHNAEAALIALHALPNPRPPVVYCVHTLLGNELSAYLRGPKSRAIASSTLAPGAAGPLTRSFDRIGDGIDRWIARRVSGWISLTHSSERVMRQFSSAPGALMPPPLPDPELALEPLNPTEVARQQALEPGRFFLYSGNLDGYQELDNLAAAAGELAGRSESPPPIVIASHWVAPRARAFSSHITRRIDHRRSRGNDSGAGRAVEWAASMPGVEFRNVESVSEMKALLSAARASLVTRRAQGGFPIKLVNSLASGTPVIAFHDREWGLTHERNSLICGLDRPALALADAIERLASDDVLAKTLAAGARALYLERHLPEQNASQTLALLREIGAFGPR